MIVKEPKPASYPRLADLPLPPAGKTGWPWTEESQTHSDEWEDGFPWPKISVVMPSYNQVKYIEETIRSVLLQGYSNLEFIVFDGGSTDGAVQILEKYDPWLTYWVSEPDRGQSHAINKGIRRATGEIIFWTNSDDICLPDAFTKVAKAFVDHPHIKLVTGQARLIDQHSNIIGELKSYYIDWEEIATNPGNSIRQVSSFFAKELFTEVGMLDENVNLAMDTDLLLRFTEYAPPLVIDDYLTAFRVHEEANTQHMLITWYEETDRTRLSFLQTNDLKSKYKQRSAQRWLNLSRMAKYSKKQRIKCLLNAIRNTPSLLLKREFWSAVYSLRRV